MEITEVYDTGLRTFGENYVQELVQKEEQLPADIEWNFIGHLQSNKVKMIAPFVSLVQSVDSLKLLTSLNDAGEKAGRVLSCLLQIHIATEETKFGLSFDEVKQILDDPLFAKMKFVSVKGLMGMATATDDHEKIRMEFRGLRNFFDQIKSKQSSSLPDFKILSMGMTSDYKAALEEGSNMVRIGSAIFGERTRA